MRLFGISCRPGSKDTPEWAIHVFADTMEDALRTATEKHPYRDGDAIIIIALQHLTADQPPKAN